MTTYDVYVATAKEPGFDWRSDGVALEQLELAVRVAGGLNSVLSLARSIDAEEVEGRKFGLGTWIAAGSREELAEVIDDNGWEHTEELDALPSEGLYLVGFET